MFAPIYICPTHGETWHVEQTEDIDCERDRVYSMTVCKICGREVTPKLINGLQDHHVLTEEEIEDEMRGPEYI